jgi:hypothetical protein
MKSAAPAGVAYQEARTDARVPGEPDPCLRIKVYIIYIPRQEREAKEGATAAPSFLN